jgi:tetratricopeptide (TPR) repeat protein
MRMMWLRTCSMLWLVVATAAGCQRTPTAPPSSTPTPSGEAVHGSGQDHGVTWLTNFDEALKLAQRDHKRVVVDAWAQWCHTCWSMKRDVLHQAALAPLQDHFVFVEVDTELPANSGFVSSHPQQFWPTFFVLDEQGTEVAHRPGAMSLTEFVAFLQSVTTSTSAEHNDFVSARNMMDAHRYADAAVVYAALARARSPRQAEAALLWQQALKRGDNARGCVTAGLQLWSSMVGAAAGDVLGAALDCLDEDVDAPSARELRPQVIEALRTLVATPKDGASVDDRADVMAMLAEQLSAHGDDKGSKQLHEQRLLLLEADAKAHPDVAGARVHDYARMNSYLALGRGDEAVALLRQRTLDAPNDYEPWARLAQSLYKLNRFDEAKPAVDKALALATGPRQGTYWLLAANIAKGRKDVAAEREALQRWLAMADKGLLSTSAMAQRADIEKRMAALPASP